MFEQTRLAQLRAETFRYTVNTKRKGIPVGLWCCFGSVRECVCACVKLAVYLCV
jgi:hypothetical protein